MKLWHISDTHGYHELLKSPDNIDIVIHSGDFSNNFNVYLNEGESHNFLFWFSKLNIKYKILIAGNHDALAFKWSTKFKKLCKELDIIYLENELVTIKGINIFGTPVTPTFGKWYFQKNRSKTFKFFYKLIPSRTDILVSHGPPRFILDLTEDSQHNLLNVGDSGLYKVIKKKLNLSYHLFGHVHNCKNILNSGTKTISNCNTIFSNGSVVTDRKFGILTSNGNIFNI